MTSPPDVRPDTIAGFDENKIVQDSLGTIMVRDQLLVAFNDGVAEEDALRVIHSAGGKVIGYFGPPDSYQAEFPVMSPGELEAVARRLGAVSGVMAAVPRFFVPVFGSSGGGLLGGLDSMWAYDNIRLDDAWAVIKRSGSLHRPVKVAVIDLGIDANHPAFEWLLNSGHLTGNGTNWSTDGPGNHGTHVTGIIAAQNLGVMGRSDAGGLDVVVNKFVEYCAVLGYVCVSDSLEMIVLLRQARQDGADVVNISMGAVPPNLLPYFREGVGKLMARAMGDAGGTLFVVAAGQTSWAEGRYYHDSSLTAWWPVDEPNLVKVAATELDATGETLASWDLNQCGGWRMSNYGNGAVAAPGTAVYTTDPDSGYIQGFCGTSAAAPMVAGTAALIRAAAPGQLSPAEIVEVIRSTADSVRFTPPTGGEITLLRVNACRAVAKVLGTTCGLLAPSNLTATATSANEIALAWQDSNSNTAGFHIERGGPGNGAFDQIASVGPDVRDYRDMGLAASTRYTYRVRAYNGTDESEYSNEASATTPSLPQLPAPPSNATAVAQSASRIALTWRDNSTDETEFRVERRTGHAAFVEITSAPANATSYSDTAVQATTTYTYRVRACNGLGCSQPSNETTATTFGPPSVTTEPASGISASEATLNGSVSPNGLATTVWFEWGTDPTLAGATLTLAVAVAATAGSEPVSHHVTRLAAGVTNYFRIVAENAADTSRGNILGFETATTALAAPSDLTAVAISASKIQLQWRDNSPDEDAFHIERRTAQTEYSEIVAVAADTTGFTDSGLSAGTEYTYRVRSCNAGGCSHYSNEAAATTASAWQAVDAGATHTCSLTAGGTIYCWGNNVLGQIGNGTTNSSTLPVRVSADSGWTAVSAGGIHSCAISGSGAAYCWGWSYWGQLGNGASGGGSSTVPVPVSGGIAFTQVSAGGNHTCGITANGAAYCWGSNSNGQLGTGNLTASAVPVPVTGGYTFASVSAGDAHTCGVTTGGDAYCWGNGGNGRLGNGSTALSRVPVAVSGGVAFTSVSAGLAHTCARTGAGQAYCWGWNSSGQLGDGSVLDRTIPVPVSGNLAFNVVSADDAHSCGVTPGGVAYCWGSNSRGQLGTGTGIGNVTPVQVAGGLAFTLVSSGGTSIGGHTCAVAPSGLFCWGRNDYGQLGVGSTLDGAAPSRVPDGG